MTHKKEICRWATRHDGTKVWVRNPNGSNLWHLDNRPMWIPSHYYVVDDKHAQIRMRWIDMGCPKLQERYPGEEWKNVDQNDIAWNSVAEYRIKPTE